MRITKMLIFVAITESKINLQSNNVDGFCLISFN